MPLTLPPERLRAPYGTIERVGDVHASLRADLAREPVRACEMSVGARVQGRESLVRRHGVAAAAQRPKKRLLRAECSVACSTHLVDLVQPRVPGVGDR
jgi:hypothetical protein